MHQRLVHRRNLHGVEPCQRDQHLGLHRVALVRHCRRAAAAREHDLVQPLLRHQADILPHFAKAPRDQRQEARVVRDPVAAGVPDLGGLQTQLARNRGNNFFGLRAQRRAVAGRAADLNPLDNTAKSRESFQVIAERQGP